MLVRALTASGGGGRIKIDTVPLTQDYQPVNCGFKPKYVIVNSANYSYAYNEDISVNTYVCPNVAWANGQYAGYIANIIVPTSSGFTLRVATYGDVGHNISFVAVE